MCSVNDQPLLPSGKKQPNIGSKCLKCQKPAVAIARIKDPFCKECFHVYVTHRFRATFGKAKLVRQNEKALLAFSGGQSSSVLLDLVRKGLSENVHKKLRFHPMILIVDDGAVLHQSWEDRVKSLSEHVSVTVQSGFPVYCTRIEEVFGLHHLWCGNHWQPVPYDPKETTFGAQNLSSKETQHHCDIPTNICATDSITVDKTVTDVSESDNGACGSASLQAHPANSDCTGRDVLHQYTRSVECEEKLVKLFDGTKTLTAKEDLLHSLRLQLIVDAARKLGCTKVIVGDNETRLSVRLFSDVAQGRGHVAPLDISFADDRYRDVMIVRPMREFPSQEIATYCVLFNLQVMTTPSLTTMATEKASIDRLTEAFIVGLQHNFPSTVNSVFRTGEKLSLPADSKSVKCSLCLAPIDSSSTEESQLCYGCQLTSRDMQQKNVPLPLSIKQDTTREVVKDYLL